MIGFGSSTKVRFIEFGVAAGVDVDEPVEVAAWRNGQAVWCARRRVDVQIYVQIHLAFVFNLSTKKSLLPTAVPADSILVAQDSWPDVLRRILSVSRHIPIPQEKDPSRL